MAKTNWNQYSATPASNTDIDSVNIDEGCPPSGINNAIRELMAHTADVVAGTTALSSINIDGGAIDGVTLGTNAAVTQAVIDNVNINGSTIGHTSDTDLLTVASGALTVAGDVTLNAQADMRFADADSSNWVAFQAPATVASNVTWTLPDADATTSGQVLSSDAAGALSWADAGGGKMLNVVTATTTTQVDTTSSSYSDTGITATITPSATSSKVLVLISVNVIATGAAAVGEFKIVRTVGATATDLYVFSQVNHLEHENAQHFLTQLDSPSTTSAAAYKLQFFRTDQSGTLTVNRNDGADIARSVIHLIEVGA